jgi:hypothetical protein
MEIVALGRRRVCNWRGAGRGYRDTRSAAAYLIVSGGTTADAAFLLMGRKNPTGPASAGIGSRRIVRRGRAERGRCGKEIDPGLVPPGRGGDFRYTNRARPLRLTRSPGGLVARRLRLTRVILDSASELAIGLRRYLPRARIARGPGRGPLGARVLGPAYGTARGSIAVEYARRVTQGAGWGTSARRESSRSRPDSPARTRAPPSRTPASNSWLWCPPPLAHPARSGSRPWRRSARGRSS